MLHSDPPPDLAALADELARLQALAQALSDREDELQAEMNQLIDQYDATTDAVKAVRLRVIEAVLKRGDASPAGVVAWHYGTEPLSVVHEAGRMFLVVPTVSDDTTADRPSTREQMARRCNLIVLGSRVIDAGQERT